MHTPPHCSLQIIMGWLWAGPGGAGLPRCVALAAWPIIKVSVLQGTAERRHHYRCLKPVTSMSLQIPKSFIFKKNLKNCKLFFTIP